MWVLSTKGSWMILGNTIQCAMMTIQVQMIMNFLTLYFVQIEDLVFELVYYLENLFQASTGKNI